MRGLNRSNWSHPRRCDRSAPSHRSRSARIAVRGVPQVRADGERPSASWRSTRFRCTTSPFSWSPSIECDLIVEDTVVVEVKSVETLTPSGKGAAADLRSARKQAGGVADQLQRRATDGRRETRVEHDIADTELSGGHRRTRRHGDSGGRAEVRRATAPRSGALTTKEPAKMQAMGCGGLYFRGLFRRQHAAGVAGRWSHAAFLLRACSASSRLRVFL